MVLRSRDPAIGGSEAGPWRLVGIEGGKFGGGRAVTVEAG